MKKNICNLLNLKNAISHIWKQQSDHENEARLLLSNFSDMDWIEFVAIDIAATLGFKKCSIAIRNDNNIEILSGDNGITVTASLKNTNLYPEKGVNTILYTGFSRKVIINGNFKEIPYTAHEAVKVLLAMEYMYYHGDSILFHPREWGNALESISQKYELPEDYLHSLLCLLPIAIPR